MGCRSCEERRKAVAEAAARADLVEAARQAALGAASMVGLVDKDYGLKPDGEGVGDESETK